jgi:UrcA family protein
MPPSALASARPSERGRDMPRLNRNRSALLGAALATALAGAAAPAFAQTAEGLTVTGHWRAGPNVRELSAAVPYADLDLNTVAGRDALKQRVRWTAQDLCERLGETQMSDPLMPTCEQDAMNSARDSIRAAIDSHRIPVYAYLPPEEPYVAPAGPTASSATSYGAEASAIAPAAPAATVTTQTVTNGPVPDTPENRALYGGPASYGGRMTTPAGN